MYPDGSVFYSEDISAYKKAELSVVPSTGTIHVKIDAWTKDQKKWTVSDGSAQDFTTVQKASGLKPGTHYQVTENGHPLGIFQSNSEGAIQFSQSGAYKSARIYEVAPVR